MSLRGILSWSNTGRGCSAGQVNEWTFQESEYYLLILGLYGHDVGPCYPHSICRPATLHKGHTVLAPAQEECGQALQLDLSRQGGAHHQQVQQDHQHL